jgi:hypothetical protein
MLLLTEGKECQIVICQDRKSLIYRLTQTPKKVGKLATDFSFLRDKTAQNRVSQFTPNDIAVLIYCIKTSPRHPVDFFAPRFFFPFKHSFSIHLTFFFIRTNWLLLIL